MSPELAIQNTISRFMNSFDLKDWAAMRQVLADRLTVDYSDLRGEPAQEIDADDYVSSRQTSLAHLKMHHLISNLEIETALDTTTVRASSLIFRVTDETHFNSHAFYEFTLKQHPDATWKIQSIKQTIFWDDGSPNIHTGAK